MHLSSGQVTVVIAGLLILGFLIVVQPFAIAVLHRKFKSDISTAAGVEELRSFFQIPYVMWFLIHHGVTMLAILAIVGLGIAGTINPATVAGLLGGLFGYVLGSATGHATATTLTARPAGTQTETPGSVGKVS